MHPVATFVLSAFTLATVAGGSIALGRALNGDTPQAEFAPGTARLTVDELATIQAANGDFWTRLELWCSFVDIADLDLRSLPRAEDGGSAIQPVSTLAEAADASPVVLQGRVRAWRMVGCNTFAVVDIERAIGTSAERVEVWIGWTLTPEPGWADARLLDSYIVHTYLPGDEVILLLDDDIDDINIPRGSLQHTLSFTSSYRVSGGRIEALPLNPFGGDVSGLTDDEFWERLETLKR